MSTASDDTAPDVLAAAEAFAARKSTSAAGFDAVALVSALLQRAKLEHECTVSLLAIASRTLKENLALRRQLVRAETELRDAGFQDLGGERWRPPLGAAPVPVAPVGSAAP